MSEAKSCLRSANLEERRMSIRKLRNIYPDRSLQRGFHPSRVHVVLYIPRQQVKIRVSKIQVVLRRETAIHALSSLTHSSHKKIHLFRGEQLLDPRRCHFLLPVNPKIRSINGRTTCIFSMKGKSIRTLGPDHSKLRST